MAKCGFCTQRKGKRECPALGAICSECCGRHRGREVACPKTCQFLPDPRVTLQVALERIGKEVVAEALRPDDTRGVKGGLAEFLGPERKVHEWEQDALVAWLAYGFVDPAGERVIDLVRQRIEAGAPSPQEREVLRALAEARGSLFEVLEVRRDEGLLLRDVATGEVVFVHERLATLQMRPGCLLLTWVMLLAGRLELLGIGTSLPPAHVGRVRTAFEAAVARRRAQAPNAPVASVTAGAMADAHRALRDAVRAYVPRALDPHGHEVLACDATYELRDAAEAQARLSAHPDFVASGEARFVWLGEPAPAGFPLPEGADSARLTIEPPPDAPDGPPVFAMLRRGRDGGPRQVLGDVELRTVRLTLSAGTRELLAAGKALLARLLGPCILLRHERVESFADLRASGRDEPLGRVPLAALDPRDPTALDVQVQRWLDAHPDATAQLEDRAARHAAAEADDTEPGARGPSEQQASPAAHRLRPLPHEQMREVVPEAMDLALRLARAERQRPGWEGRTITPDALARSDDFAGVLGAFGRALMLDAGYSREAAAHEAHTLASHVHYAANHELHHRKTFWVDETLAWALAQTELDVPGACLRLPFPTAAFVFSDPATLELADSLLAGDARGFGRQRPARMLTVYVVRGVVHDHGTDVRMAFLFDRGEAEDPESDGWTYLLARDMVVRPDDRLDAILDSRHDDLPPGGSDPVFLAPEMKKLVHLTINAILYSTSRLLEPKTVGPQGKRRRARRGPGGPGPGRRSSKGYSDEDVFHLPGTIDITSMKRLRELERTDGGLQVLRRFMVRGHWRRAAATWGDQRLRWISPYWKGPDMGMIIERNYRLRP